MESESDEDEESGLGVRRRERPRTAMLSFVDRGARYSGYWSIHDDLYPKRAPDVLL